MTLKFPVALQKKLEEAALHLWDKSYPEPDLSSMAVWLETDGWDFVVNGLYSSCIYSSVVMNDLDDETLMEHIEVTSRRKIKNSDRILFTKNHIEYLLSDSMDSLHSIPIEFRKMPPAELCFTMYYHGQGGAMFGDFQLCHSSEEFIEQFEGDIILTPDDLSDLQILNLWKQSEEQLKSWRRSLS